MWGVEPDPLKSGASRTCTNRSEAVETHMKFSLVLGALWLAVVPSAIPAGTIPPSRPKPRAEHPGHVFLAGEDLVLQVADSWGRWVNEDKHKLDLLRPFPVDVQS